MASSDNTLITLAVLGVVGYFLYHQFAAGTTGQTQVVSPTGHTTTTTNPPPIGSTTNAAPGTTFYNPNGTGSMVDNNGNVIPLP